MKKTIAILLAMMLIVGMLAGCGAKPASTDAPAPAEGSAEEWPAVTIQYVNINSESMGGARVEAMIDEFNKTNGKNITVEFNFISANYPEIASEVLSYLAAGQSVGVVQVGYAYINYFADNFPMMQDINNVIETYFPEDKDFLSETYSEPVLNLGYALNGSLIGVPFGMSTPVLFYNADLCKEAGLDVDNPPKTWNEVADWADAVIEKTGKSGVAIQNPSDTYSILPVFLSSGIDSVIVEEDGKYSANLLTDDSVAAWTLLQEMTQKGQHVQLTLDEAVGAFAGGELAMMLTTSGRSTYFANNCEFEVRTAMQPGFEGFDLKVCTGGNVMSIISDDEAEIKASWELIKFLLKPENIGTWCTVTGYLPPTKNADNDPAVQEFVNSNVLIKAAIEEKEFAAQWTSWPGKNGLQVDQYLVNMRDAIMSNNEDVETAIKDAQDTINDLLK
jgi:multiple sugar transport system substrate-binding protein